MSKNVLAIANCRVSSAEQLQNNSLTRQETSVYAAAKRLNIKLVRVWSGSVSSKAGTNIRRKDLEEMLDLCRRDKRIKYVIIDELDRFMRSMLELGHFIVEFNKQGVEVVFASQPNLKTNTATEKLLLMLEAYKAEGSNEERISKSISSLTAYLKAGKYPFSPKPGYMRGRRTGVLEIHPVRGPALRDVLIRVASRTVSPTEGLIELNRSDYTHERTELKMDKFRKIATDPFYAGIVEIRKQVNARSDEGEHDPLISLAQHRELVRIFTAKKKNQSGPRKNGNPEYPLNAITMHDACLDKKNKGKFVGFNHGNGKNPNLVYKKYRCRSCKLYITRDEMHLKISKLFESSPITKKGSKDLLDALDVVWNRKEAQARLDSIRIDRKVSTLKEDISNRAIAAIDPSNASIKEDILNNIEQLKAEVSELEEELLALSKKADADRRRFMQFALSLVGNMGESFLSLTPENVKKCKQIIFPAGFYIDADENVYTPEISPLYRLATSKKDTEVSQKAHLVRVRRL